MTTIVINGEVFDGGEAVRLLTNLFLTLFFSLGTLLVSAQNADTGELANALWFDDMIGTENSGLIKGVAYLPRLRGRISDPFLERRRPFPGSVVYEQQPYYNVALLYDIYQDILILSHNQNNTTPILMAFDEAAVSSFTLEARPFEYVEVRDSTVAGVGSGYFEVLVQSGLTRLLAKRRKVDYLEKGIREFRDSHLYFIELRYAPGALIPVVSRKSFELVFPEKVEALKQFVKTNKLRPRRGDESHIIRMFEFCDPPITSVE